MGVVSWMLGNPLPLPVALGADLALLALVVAVGLVWSDGRRAVVTGSAGRRAVRHAALTSAGAGLVVAAGLLLPPAYLVLGVATLGARGTAVLPLVPPRGARPVHAGGALPRPRPRPRQRAARRAVRSVADVAPTLTRRLAWAWTALLVVAAVAFGLVASGPRAVSRVVGPAEAYTVTPFPGWLWTGPVLVVAAVSLVASEAVLRLVRSRPAVEDVGEEWDMWLRRRVARRVERATQLVLGLTLGGLVAFAGLSLRWLGLGNGDGARLGPGPSAGEIVAGNVLLAVAACLVLVVLVASVWPARDPAPAARAPFAPEAVAA